MTDETERVARVGMVGSAQPLGEALFALSDRLARIGALESDNVHAAYETVVKRWQQLSDDLADMPTIWVIPDHKPYPTHERPMTPAEAKAYIARLEREVRTLQAALRVARGWVINGTSSAQARRDLCTVDAALGIVANSSPMVSDTDRAGEV